MKSYNEFILSTNETYQIFESIQLCDRKYFLNIFNSIYEYHLNESEKFLINNFNYRLNESWFSDLKDKAERGVLKIQSQAGELLTNIAQKAKDILDFVKQLATQIKESVTKMFNESLKTLKNKIIPKPELLTLITEYLNKKGENLKKWINETGTLLKFIFAELPIKLFNKLINFFKDIFNKGKNEGFSYFCDRFLNEAEENVEEKSFLQKLGEKIASLPPFSWIPKIDEMIKFGVHKIREFIEKFFVWLDNDNVSEKLDFVDLQKGKSKFTRGLYLIFDILEIYIVYIYNQKIGKNLKKFQDAIKNGENTIIEKFKDEIKNKSLEEIYTQLGISPQEVVNKVLDLVKKIPYVSDILSILNNLALCVGIYQVIQPTLEKIKPPVKEQPTTQPTAQPAEPTAQPSQPQPATA